MRVRQSLYLLSVVSLGLTPNLVEGQIIDVQRGYVRAPFVRVQRSPGSRARVRAPFVDVGGRARRNRFAEEEEQAAQSKHPRTPFPVPMVPPAQSEPIDQNESPRERLTNASRQLDVELLTVQNGTTWVNYLALPESMTSPELAGTPTREELIAVWRRFEAVRTNGRYRTIASLPAFATTRRDLRNYIVALDEADQQRAVASEHPQIDGSPQVR